jgi:GTP-binding protein YchF
MENLGLVGFTGAGANRLFAALTGLAAPSEYEAAVGVAAVPDERLDQLAAMSASKKVVPASFELVHLALPPGSKPGEGLGAKFLGTLRNCDAILIVLRAFDDGAGAPDPEGDLAAIELELVMADLTSVEQRLDRQRRAAKSGDKEIAAEVEALEKAHVELEGGMPLSRSGLSADDMARLAAVFALTTKPLLLVANTGEQTETGTALPAGALAVPVDIEAEIAACAPEDREEMRAMYSIGESALDTVAHAAYHLLGRRTFLTTGDKESRAWTFRAGAKAPECAGVIHSDLQRGFIRAEVIRWDELLEIGSWDKARSLGKLRVEGKEYEVQDGDTLEIRFNV